MKKLLVMITLLLCLSMLFMGCGNKTKQTDTNNQSAEEDNNNTSSEEVTEPAAEDLTEDDSAQTEDTDSDTSETLNSGEFTCIVDVSDYWNDLYNANEAVLNAFDSEIIMELVTPGLSFITGVQYDMLNLSNVDGHFEGELFLAGYPGFVDKKGAQLTFGYEDVSEKDSFLSSKGDKLVENGNCDLDTGYYFTDSYTDRAGVKISRSTSEFQKQEDGSMCAIIINGSTMNYRKEEDLTTSYIFVRNGKNQYDIVIANSTIGTEYEILHLEANMTKENAIELFKSAGLTITKSGGIKDGVFYLD